MAKAGNASSAGSPARAGRATLHRSGAKGRKSRRRLECAAPSAEATPRAPRTVSEHCSSNCSCCGGTDGTHPQRSGYKGLPRSSALHGKGSKQALGNSPKACAAGARRHGGTGREQRQRRGGRGRSQATAAAGKASCAGSPARAGQAALQGSGANGRTCRRRCERAAGEPRHAAPSTEATPQAPRTVSEHCSSNCKCCGGSNGAQPRRSGH